MSAFTIKAVGEPREWRSEKFGGTFLAYPVDLEDAEGKLQAGVEWSRKPESEAPKVGDRIAGNISGGAHGDKFKMDYEATKELSGGGGSSDYRSNGSGKSTWKSESTFDPEKVARITRSAAQKVAVELLNAVPGFPEAPKPNKQQAITAWSDFFAADIQKAAAVAMTKDAMGATEVPAIRPAAADGEIVDEEGIPF